MGNNGKCCYDILCSNNVTRNYILICVRQITTYIHGLLLN